MFSSYTRLMNSGPWWIRIILATTRRMGFVIIIITCPIRPSILANTLTGTFRQLTLASEISCASTQTGHYLMHPLRRLSRNGGH